MYILCLCSCVCMCVCVTVDCLLLPAVLPDLYANTELIRFWRTVSKDNVSNDSAHVHLYTLLLVTPVQLIGPGIGRNTSYAICVVLFFHTSNLLFTAKGVGVH